jgi:tRNA pseudouridine55 synthase
MEQGTRSREAPVSVRAASGILNVDKPVGWTSFDVVAFVRRRSGVKRVGHAGTLDPAATGVLPLLLGGATRLAEYLVDATKAYAATIELGLETDTYDAAGEALRRTDASGVDRAQIEAALAAFRGEIEQRAPAFSAIKRSGVALYRRSRRGEAVEPPVRRVRVDALDIISFDAPFLRLAIECGKGFYVRSLAHDLGAALGVGGSLAALRRTRVGPFRVEDALDVETLRRQLESGEWLDRLWPPDEVLLGWRAAILGDVNAGRLAHGQTLSLATAATRPPAAAERCRAYGLAGEFLGVLRAEGATAWRPEKVFAPS